ncbi:hypothetical protein D3C85_1498590 [compost metagenome]
MTDELHARQLIRQLHDEQELNEQQIRESEQRTFSLRVRQAELTTELRELRARHRQAVAQRLADAESADRRPKHYGYTFNTYDSAEAAFILSYLSRNREEHSGAHVFRIQEREEHSDAQG